MNLKDKNLSDQNVIAALSELLADTYIVYVKTQNFHWNVTGSHFYALHKFFEEQYQALAEAVDVLAERIRALKAYSPASFSEFQKLATLKEVRTDKGGLNDKKMVEALMKDHKKIGENIEKYFTIADKNGDEVTLDLFIQRKTEHDKFAWMLRSTLGKA